MHPPLPISSGLVHVHLFMLDDPVVLEQADAILSSDEKERAGRYRFERDRNRFSCGRAHLRRLLSGYTGIPADRISFWYTAFGKPSIEGAITFNLSHSEDLMVVAVARNRMVGVDIEKIKPLNDIVGMAGIVFTKDEEEILRRQTDSAKRSCFFAVWTLKEALLKAAGTGIGQGMNDVSVLVPKDPAGGYSPVSPVVCNGVSWETTTLHDLPPGYAGALCREFSSDGPLLLQVHRMETKQFAATANTPASFNRKVIP